VTSKRLGTVVAFLCLLSAVGNAQDGRFDVAVGVGETLNKQVSGNSADLTPTNTPMYFASLSTKLPYKTSLQFNYARARIGQKYTTPTLDYRVFSNVTEFSGQLSFRPVQYGNFSPFVFAGAGALVFNPNDTQVDETEAFIGALRQYRPAFLYGGGVDYHVMWRFSLRLQYRGLLYSAPDFKVKPLFTGQKGHMAEGCAGIVFNF